MSRGRLLPTILWLGLLGCGGNPEIARDADGSATTVVFRLDAEPPGFGDIPFPSDLYKSESSGLVEVPGLRRLAGGNLAAIDQALASLDGFGRSTAAVFCLEGELSAGALEATEGVSRGVLFVDIDPASPARGTVLSGAARHFPSLGCVGALPVPGLVLAPGTRHAAVLTTSLHGDDGRPLTASAELRRIRELEPAQRSTRGEQLYGEALDALVELGAVDDEREVAGLAVFTTSRMADELMKLADRLRDQSDAPSLMLDPAEAAPMTGIVFGTQTTPSLSDWLGTPDTDETGREWPGGDNPGGIAHDAIGAVASGAFLAPSFLDAKTGRFERDGSGQIAVGASAVKIPVTLVIPASPAPAAGYPVIVNGHGLSNNRGSMLALANEFARAGFATIGIDDVEHGARLGIVDEQNNYPGSYRGPDGIPDEMTLPLAFFAGFSDFLVIRDNLRQSVLDQVSLVRLVGSSALDLSDLGVAAGLPAPRLDPGHVYYNGGSLGGIVGTMTIAVEPSIRAAVLEVPGGGFAHMITTNSAKMFALVDTIIRGSFQVVGSERLDEYHPLVNLLAQTMEAGDPLAYAPHVLLDPFTPGRPPPSVLVTYARHDEVLPNIATFALIRALGIPVVGTALSEPPLVARADAPAQANLAGTTAGASEYAPANHGLGYGRYDVREFVPGVPLEGPDGAFPRLPGSFTIEMPVREHTDQIVHFLSSAHAGTAEIIQTAPPIADFDADGVLDDDERAAGTDPWDPSSN